MKESDTERLKKIVQTWDKLSTALNERAITQEQVLVDEFAQWAITTPLYNIGEQVYNLSDSFKSDHSELPWTKVAGLRHRLVHDYDGINWSIISEVVFKDMNPFVEAVSAILNDMNSPTE